MSPIARKNLAFSFLTLSTAASVATSGAPPEDWYIDAAASQVVVLDVDDGEQSFEVTVSADEDAIPEQSFQADTLVTIKHQASSTAQFEVTVMDDTGVVSSMVMTADATEEVTFLAGPRHLEDCESACTEDFTVEFVYLSGPTVAITLDITAEISGLGTAPEGDLGVEIVAD